MIYYISIYTVSTVSTATIIYTVSTPPPINVLQRLLKIT